MTALVVGLTLLVLLLAVLVAGLLRSHADILRALHSLGAGVGDPLGELNDTPANARAVPIRMGPSLPAERSSTSAPDVVGTTVHDDAVVVATSAAPHTLLAFLSSGCATCAVFWHALRTPERLRLPAGLRIVVVAKGPDLDDVGVLRTLASPTSIDVVLSTQAWVDYEVPGAPFFALVDGATQRRVGEGLASTMDQVIDLVTRAIGDRTSAWVSSRLAGPAREADNDQLLLDAGIRPGDPSLYPGSGRNGAPRR